MFNLFLCVGFTPSFIYTQVLSKGELLAASFSSPSDVIRKAGWLWKHRGLALGAPGREGGHDTPAKMGSGELWGFREDEEASWGSRARRPEL